MLHQRVHGEQGIKQFRERHTL